MKEIKLETCQLIMKHPLLLSRWFHAGSSSRTDVHKTVPYKLLLPTHVGHPKCGIRRATRSSTQQLIKVNNSYHVIAELPYITVYIHSRRYQVRKTCSPLLHNMSWKNVVTTGTGLLRHHVPVRHGQSTVRSNFRRNSWSILLSLDPDSLRCTFPFDMPSLRTKPMDLSTPLLVSQLKAG